MNKPANKSTLFAWMICGLGALFYCYEYFLRVAPSVMSNDLMQVYGLSAGAFGNLAAFYYYAYTPLQLPVGVMMDYYGPRRLLIFACLLCASGTYLFSLGTLLWVAQLGRFLVGFGSAFAFVGVLKLATIWLPARYFGMIAGLATTLGLLGAMAGDIVMTYLVKLEGWRTTTFYSAATGIILALIIGLCMPDTKGKLEEPRESKRVAFQHLFSGVWKLLKNPHMWLTGFIGCALYLPLSAFAELWGVPYLEAAHHFTAQEAAHANSVVFLGFAIGGPLFGWFSDRIRRRCLPLMIGAGISCATITSVLYLSGLPHQLLFVLLFLFGASTSAQVIVFAIGRELTSPKLAGTAVAFTNMVVMVGGVIFQPLVGILLDAAVGHTGERTLHYSVAHYQSALMVLPVAAFLSLLALMMLRETHAEQKK